MFPQSTSAAEAERLQAVLRRILPLLGGFREKCRAAGLTEGERIADEAITEIVIAMDTRQ